MPLHRLEQIDTAGDIVLIVFQRYLGGLTHRLQSGEVNDRIDGMRSK
jgi:hypothetical protein